MKKVMATMLAFILLLTAVVGQGTFTLSASAEESEVYEENGFQYTIYDSYYPYAIIVGYVGCVSDLDIPYNLGGYPVEVIESYAFNGCQWLKSVYIPETVTYIGYNAFDGCSNLTDIFVDDYNWYYRSVDGVLFDDRMDTLICYPCGKSGDYTIPDGVTYIDGSAFWGCDSLTSVTIPDSVTSIGYDAFYNCDSLTTIDVDRDNPNYSSLDGVLFDKDKVTLIQCPGRKSGDYTIPDSVTSIGDYAFSNRTSLTSVTIPDSVTTIGGYAFYFCTSLTSVTIGDSVTTISYNAFYFCTSLTSVTIPDSVTTIGNYAFSYCDSLTSIDVTQDNPNYSSLDGVLFNKDKTTLIQCPGGKSGAYTIPDSVTTIGNYAFSDCDSLTTVTIPNSVTSIGRYAFYNCDSLTTVTIGDSVTSIGDSAFCSCDSLTSVTIPDSVTSIGDSAFCYCDSLTSVTIPDSVTSIGDSAFYDCDSLTDVWYTGSESDRTAIDIASNNSYLENARWHYNVCSDEHSYDNACDTRCNACEWVRVVEPHTYADATCMAPKICTNCGITDGEALGHAYVATVTYPDCENGGFTTHTCSRCGDSYVDQPVAALGHAYTNSCDTTCNRCDAYRTVTHIYDHACDTTCNVCGVVRQIQHAYDYSCDTTCNVCGYYREIQHTYDNACDAECNVCGDLRQVEPHVYDNACDAICNECGYQRTPDVHKADVQKYIFTNDSRYPFKRNSNGEYYSTNKSHSSSSTATLTVTANGTITIEYKTSTEANYDKLIIKLNGIEQVIQSGSTSWKTVTLQVKTGDTITISYNKDAIQSSNGDTVYFKLEEPGGEVLAEDAEPTCTEAVVCTECGIIVKEALGHDYDGDCDNQCNRCDEYRDAIEHTYDNACDAFCNGCGFERWVGAHMYDNTCDTVCNECGYERTITHRYADATCTAPKTCTVCGATDGEALGHVYDHDCDTVCNRCYETRTITHKYAAATCTDPKTCTVCGAVDGNALGHKYDNACDKTCNRCADTRDVGPHVYTHALCDKDCDVCGAVRTAPHLYTDSCDIDCNLCKTIRKVTHTFDNDCDEYCNVCGDYREVPDHEYSHRCDRDCNVCFAIRTVTHKYSNKCDNTCNYCGAKRKVAAHTYKLAVAKKATATANGYSIKTCTECGKTEGDKVTIYKIGHVKLSKTTYTYNGKAQKPTVSAKDSMGNKISSAHYTVKYADGKSAGTQKVTVTFKGDYSGTKILTYKIKAIDVSKCKITLSATSYTYDGKAHKPSVTIKDSNGKKIAASSYTVTYASGCKNVGTYKVTIKMKGNYTGTKTLTYKINPAGTSVSKLTAAKKALKVTVAKKTTQVTGYQIQYSTSKSFSSAKTKTLSSYKTTSATLSGLSAKKTYYVRVRTYKTVNGVKYYSGWSTVKSLKTK